MEATLGLANVGIDIDFLNGILNHFKVITQNRHLLFIKMIIDNHDNICLKKKLNIGFIFLLKNSPFQEFPKIEHELLFELIRITCIEVQKVIDYEYNIFLERALNEVTNNKMKEIIYIRLCKYLKSTREIINAISNFEQKSVDSTLSDDKKSIEFTLVVTNYKK